MTGLQFKRTLRQVKLTKEYAESYLALPGLPGERTIQNKRFAELVSAMDDGRFLPEHACLATIVINGVEYKGNGQHTCWAVLHKKNGSVYAVTQARYQARDMAEASLIYRQFDPPASVRTYVHVFTQHNTGNRVFESLQNRRVAFLFAGAMAFEEGGRTEYGRRTISRERKIGMCEKHPQLLAALNGLLGEHGNRHLYREPVACAIIQTLLRAKDDAMVFWGDVRDGAGLQKDSPQKKLEVWLRETAYAFGRGGARVRKATFHEMYSKCLHAWNAFRNGKKTDLKYFKSAGLPQAK